MRAIELASQFNWKNIWIETDSTLVVSAFTTRSNCVPWFLRNRWHNSLLLLNGMNCFITHINREGVTARIFNKEIAKKKDFISLKS
jgi:ribonuclease HI